MLRTYKGRYEYGKFILPEQALIPDTADIIITVLDDDIISKQKNKDEKLNEEQRAVVEKVLKNLENIRKEDFTEEEIEHFKKLERGDYKLRFDRREGL